MEKCAICETVVVERDSNHNTITAQPHTQCRSCGAIACEACATKKQCPVCGYDGMA